MKTYVVLDDIVSLFRDKYGKTISERDLDKLQDTLFRAIDKIVGVVDADLIYINKEIIIKWYNILRNNFEYKVISVDWSMKGDYRLDVCRIVDPNTLETVGIGNRLYTPPLKDQILSIPPGNYILVDEGVFTGSSLLQLLGMLFKYNINVKKLVLGILTDEGYNKLLKLFKDNEIEYFVKVDAIEWADARDLLGLDGKVSVDGYVIPYFAKPGWLSLPESFSEILKKYWELSQKILEKYNIRVPWHPKILQKYGIL